MLTDGKKTAWQHWQRIHRVKPIHSKIKDLFVSDAVKRQWKRGRWCFTQFLYCMFPHLKIPSSGHIPNLGTCPNQKIDLASSQNMSKSQCCNYWRTASWDSTGARQFYHDQKKWIRKKGKKQTNKKKNPTKFWNTNYCSMSSVVFKDIISLTMFDFG